ncbi:pantoate--beta-alanine ligase [Buchnera aphidicola (Periphyllus koelreuteriae)]|uniref:pantoate--beta-alanine ligase n=1 Tax=Buchnera aphidicola TaxID=9 RepID=UPI0031B8579E
MKIIKTKKKLLKELKKNKFNISLIPTMGNIHQGHLFLIKKSIKISNLIIVSIFLNKLQFNKLQDFINYPKTIKEDLKKLKKNKVDIVFLPHEKEIYPDGFYKHTIVSVKKTSTILENKNRTNHLNGVSTIICKLFNLIQPQYSIFGEKDYQQLYIIKTLVKELNYNIKIISIPIIREKNGLAISSRNNLLKKNEKKQASCIYKYLKKIKKKMYYYKFKIFKKIKKKYKKKFLKKKIKLESLYIRDSKNLKIISKNSKKAIILISVFIKNIRLIDNIFVNLKKNK